MVRLVVPCECSAEADERHDGEHTAAVHSVEAVEHIPHDVEIAAYIFCFFKSVVVPVERAAEETQTPADVGRHPFAERKIIAHGDMVLFFAVGQMVFHER